MRKLIAILGTFAGQAAALAIVAGPAQADPPVCIQWDDETGVCTLYAGDEGGSPDGGTDADQVSDDSGGGTVECLNNGQKVPCTSPGGFYWSNDMGCYVRRVPAQPPKYMPVWEGHTNGAVYECREEGSDTAYQFWAPAPPAGAAAPPDPEDLAQQALALMNLHMFEIGVTPKPGPDHLGYVGLPTWLWVADQSPSTWGPISRSVSAGGITVTATATVDHVVWEMGDGQTVNCATAGTPYRASYGDSDSPDCGYRYTRSSADQPNNAYTVTATAYWVVNWSGAGASGQIPLDFTDSAQIRIGEAQALGQ